MLADTNERAGFEERYLAASTTSDLTVTAERRTAADVIIAAGLAHGQLGQALIHLRSEWDRAGRPAKRSAAWIAARAAQITDKKGRPDIRRATIEAMVWHATAMRERASKLSGRSTVLGLLREWAVPRGIDPDLLSPALFHWLNPTCPACNGLGKNRMPDAPALAKKNCNHCQGEGTWPRPLGAEDIHRHMKECIGAVKGQASARMR